MTASCKDGFTLIELLLVTAVISILAAIAIPQFNSYRTRGYDAAAASDLHHFRMCMETYMQDQRTYPDLQ